MSSLTSDQYELLVRNLAEGFSIACTELGKGVVQHGRSNKIQGASTYKHQIDVSLEFPKHLVLIECKNWKDPVDPEALLAHSARHNDIAAAFPDKTVLASLVSTRPASAGAKLLAEKLDVSLDIVVSVNDYVITIVKRHFVGMVEHVLLTDRIDGWVTPGTG